jgi:hypothetical protein
MIPVYGPTLRRRFLRAGWLLICLYPPLVKAQTPTRNYIQTYTVQKPTTGDRADTLSIAARQRQIQYFDDLGRPIQTISVNGAPNASDDVVQPMQYDAFGREVITYLPYVTSGDGAYKTDPTSSSGVYTGSPHYNFYTGTDRETARSPYPYAVRAYELSPSGRVIQQGAPGEAWQPKTDANADHTVKTAYETNRNNEVRYLPYNEATGDITLNAAQQYYPHGVLYVTRTLDEQHNEQITYTDKAGRVMLKKVQYGADASGTKLYAETYYIYDLVGNLMYVLPPEASRRLTTSH